MNTMMTKTRIEPTKVARDTYVIHNHQGEGTAPRDVGTDPQQHGGDGEVGQHGLIEVEPGAPVEPRADDDDCADRTGRPRQPSLRGRHLHG